MDAWIDGFSLASFGGGVDWEHLFHELNIPIVYSREASGRFPRSRWASDTVHVPFSPVRAVH